MVGVEAPEADAGRDADCDTVGLGCALEHFAEVEEVLAMVDNVRNVYNTRAFEVEYEKLYTILKQYYEQPHLLDPHLDRLLARFVQLVRDEEAPFAMKHAVFCYMYQIIRVRGYKVVVRHLPHEVSDLLTVLSYLEEQDPADKETWRSRFVLLLWLSIVVIIPFHMSRLDGFIPSETDTGSTKKLTVMERIFNICKTYALSRDSCAEASAYLASKFLVRSDVKELYLGAFFSWVCELHPDLQADSVHHGALAAAAAVLKHGKRADLLPHAPRLLRWLTAHDHKHHKAMLVRKYAVKIVQRIGLTFLRPRVAAWRYTRGARSLAVTLGAPAGDAGHAPAPVAPPATPPADDDDEQDIPPEVEEVVELLLVSLCDEDTVVRWSAAKGVGRVAARLPAPCAADVCACVLALCTPQQREHAWHGACMALAELARRGLLSPAQLGAAVAAACAALRRDEPRAAGGGGGGRAARDAACHAAWAVARAYPAAALAPHAVQLANALIATACFDREINCRRAASAAFQENVGRHGMFPHGIQVLTAADFHAVGPRHHAYLVVAPQVAQHAEYARPLLAHLLELKLQHWDGAVRELAAEALDRITPILPEYVATVALPQLLEMTESAELHVRHGAVLGVGAAVLALSRARLQPPGTGAAAAEVFADSLISEATLAGVRELAARMRARGLLRGLGGELTRQAVCSCLSAVAQAQLQADACTVDEWLSLVEECLSHESDALRDKAAAALARLAAAYLRGESTRARRDALVRRCCTQLASTARNGLYERMGYARAIGALPAWLVAEHADAAASALAACTRVSESTRTWAEARREAARALAALCRAMGAGAAPLVPAARDALLLCLDEYTTDMRGDIGAWVREAAMTGLVSLCQQCAAEAPELNTAESMQRVCAGVAQQALEKIDRTRALAGRLFTRLIYSDPPIANIPDHETLKRIFPPEDVEVPPLGHEQEERGAAAALSENSSAVLWLFPGHTMPRFVQLLGCPAYRRSALTGLVVSAGELTESLVRHTTTALFAYLRALHDARGLATLRAVCAEVVAVFADNLHVRRITGPMFNFLDRLLSSGCLSPILEDPESTFASDVLACVQLELKGGKNIYKLLDSINVLCQLIQVGGAVSRRALSQLVLYLCYADRYVRRSAAARLYEALALYGGAAPVPPATLDQVMSILADTDWEADVGQLRPVRNQLCDLMGIKRPVPRRAAPAADPAPPAP